MAASAETELAAPPGARRRGYGPRYPGWLTLPSIAYYLLVFVAPMVILVVFALGRFSGFGTVTYALQLGNFREAFTGADGLYRDIFLRSLRFALTGTVLTVLIGYPVAYWIARYAGRRKSLALVLVILPFWTSFLIRTASFLIILAPNFALSRALQQIHAIATPLSVLNTGVAVQIGIVYNYLPLLVLPVYAALERMDWRLVEAALDMGATPARAFREVTLPLTLPGLVTGAMLVFIPMTGEYVIPNILGGGTFQLAGSLIGQQFLGAANWPLGSAFAITLMLMVLPFVLVYLYFAAKEEQFGA